MKYTGLLDLIDGGGAGTSGSEFKGGLLSNFLNEIGIRPRGYRDRQEQMVRPQMRPRTAAPMPSPVSTAPIPQQAPQPAPQPMGSGMTPANNYVPEKQYGGRGMVGMPIPYNLDEETVSYLRSVGMSPF